MSALAPLSAGGLRYAEQATGDVWQVDKQGRREPTPLAHVDVATGGERGILGVTVADHDRTFATWTDPTGAFTVCQVVPVPHRPS